MALPRTRLTQAIDEAGGDPERVHQALVAGRWISPSRASSAVTREFVAQAAAQLAAQEHPGPDFADLLAAGLERAGLLTRAGARRAQEPFPPTNAGLERFVTPGWFLTCGAGCTVVAVGGVLADLSLWIVSPSFLVGTVLVSCGAFLTRVPLRTVAPLALLVAAGSVALLVRGWVGHGVIALCVAFALLVVGLATTEHARELRRSPSPNNLNVD